MGKTIQPVPGIGQLAALRSGSRPPSYRSQRQTGPRLDLRAGYYHPEMLLDSAEEASDGRHLFVKDALYLPPFSAVYANEEEARLRTREVLDQALQGALPELETEASVVPGNSDYRFRSGTMPYYPLTPLSGTDELQDEPYSISPTLPLIVTRPEQGIENEWAPNNWASAVYAYDPYVEKWYLLGRYGRNGEEAYEDPFRAYHTARQHGTRMAKSIWDKVAYVRSSISVGQRISPARCLDQEKLLRPGSGPRV